MSPRSLIFWHPVLSQFKRVESWKLFFCALLIRNLHAIPLTEIQHEHHKQKSSNTGNQPSNSSTPRIRVLRQARRPTTMPGKTNTTIAEIIFFIFFLVCFFISRFMNLQSLKAVTYESQRSHILQSIHRYGGPNHIHSFLCINNIRVDLGSDVKRTHHIRIEIHFQIPKVTKSSARVNDGFHLS